MKRKGVTLIEVLAILAFLALLAAIIVPNFIRARPRGTVTACKSNLKNIATALEMFSVDEKGAYPATLAGLTPNYLKLIPNCPSANFDTYSQSYESHVRPLEKPRVFCQGHHPPNQECETNLVKLNERSALDPTIRCPLAGPYKLIESEASFTVFCQGENHKAANLATDFPKYTSSQGLIER